MGVTISFGIQKGGAGKTTTTAITAFLLARAGKKVLAVDFDSQGNLTQFLTQRNIYDFTNHTVLDALKIQNAVPFVHPVMSNLDILPAEDLLITFSSWLYQKYQGTDPSRILKDTLEPVKDNYDYILIDLPPNLGDHTINALTASDYAVVLLQSEPFCYDALDRYLETLQLVKDKTNPNLVLAGILTVMLDSRTTLDSAILEKANHDYEDVVFTSVIKRRSRIKEFTVTGLQINTKADLDALEPYENFVKELIDRVQ
ncbi:ParA family protein [Paenibacillus puldeungensis]|uniref:ParA family protein n=1 Tax=Paenibacillus puldeungensis TaxID=696536 RepID=A0ABW3S4J0_9BACL